MIWSEILFLIKTLVKNSLSSLLSAKLQYIFKNLVLSKLGVNVDLWYPSSNIFFQTQIILQSYCLILIPNFL